MKLIHLSDTHILPAPDRLYGLDPRARLAAAVEDINAQHADAGLCVVTGDIAHWGEPAAYACFADAMSRLAVPYVPLMGNHDHRDAFRAAFPEALVDGEGFIQGVRECGGHTLIFLDTKDEGTHAGAFCAARQHWLRQALDTACGPVLLFLHHPPFDIGVPAIDAIRLQDAEAFANIVVPHAARIRHMFMGHVHLGVAGSWRGIPFTMLPSQNHQLEIGRSSLGMELWGCNGQPRYAVARITPEHVVIHERNYMARLTTFSLDADEGMGRGYALGMAPIDD